MKVSVKYFGFHKLLQDLKKKVIKTEMCNVVFHNKFIKFGLFCFVYFLPTVGFDFHIYLYIYIYIYIHSSGHVYAYRTTHTYICISMHKNFIKYAYIFVYISNNQK